MNEITVNCCVRLVIADFPMIVNKDNGKQVQCCFADGNGDIGYMQVDKAALTLIYSPAKIVTVTEREPEKPAARAVEPEVVVAPIPVPATDLETILQTATAE